MNINVCIEGPIYGAPCNSGCVAPLGYNDIFCYSGPLSALGSAYCRWRHQGKLDYKGEYKLARYILGWRFIDILEKGLRVSRKHPISWVEVCEIAHDLSQDMCDYCRKRL